VARAPLPRTSYELGLPHPAPWGYDNRFVYDTHVERRPPPHPCHGGRPTGEKGERGEEGESEVKGNVVLDSLTHPPLRRGGSEEDSWARREETSSNRRGHGRVVLLLLNPWLQGDLAVRDSRADCSRVTGGMQALHYPAGVRLRFLSSFITSSGRFLVAGCFVLFRRPFRSSVGGRSTEPRRNRKFSPRPGRQCGCSGGFGQRFA